MHFTDRFNSDKGVDKYWNDFKAKNLNRKFFIKHKNSYLSSSGSFTSHTPVVAELYTLIASLAKRFIDYTTDFPRISKICQEKWVIETVKRNRLGEQ